MMTLAHRQALDWLRQRGREAAVATTKRGGRVYLAQGENGPFTAATVRALIDQGYLEYVAVDDRPHARIRLVGGV